MNWKQHIMGGMIFVAVTYLILLLLNVITLELRYLFLIPLVLLYSILPDVDTRASKINRFFIIVITFFSVLSIFFPFINWITTSLLVFLLIGTLSKHRGFIHSWLFGLITIVPIFLIFGEFFAIFCFISYISHLFLDKIGFKLI